MAQDASDGDRSTSEANRSTLEVKPGKPAVKTTELERKPVAPWTRLPRYILSDQKSIWTSPFHTSSSDAKYWAIFGGTGAALIASDKWTSRQLPNTNDQIAVARWTSRIGAIYTLLPINAGIYFTGAFAKNEKLRETGFLGFEALTNAALVSTGIKLVTRRERPLEGQGDGRFWQSSGASWNASFPSGHAIETWALASVVAHEYPRPLIVPILAYGLATTVSGSRFAARKHFASDVVLGAAMGWFIGDFVFAKRHNPDTAMEPWRSQKQSKLRSVLAHVHIGVQ